MQPQRAHHRQAGHAAFVNRAVEIRHQPIAQLRTLQIGSTCALCSSDVGIAGGAVIRRDHLGHLAARVPAPRQPQLPRPSVRSEQRTERAELEPPHIQLSRELRRRHEAADVGAPRGMPVSPVLIAIGTCVRSVSQVEKCRPTRGTTRSAACRRSRCDGARTDARRDDRAAGLPNTCDCASGVTRCSARRPRRATSRRRRARRVLRCVFQ